jgi:hypothetical protein
MIVCSFLLQGPTKKAIMKSVADLLDQYYEHKNVLVELLTSGLNKAMDRTGNFNFQEIFIQYQMRNISIFFEIEREEMYTLMLDLVGAEMITPAQFPHIYRNVLEFMTDMEADISRIKSYVSAYAARAVSQRVFFVSEVSEFNEGNHYPFLPLVLQQLSKTMDKTKLCNMFEESKVSFWGVANIKVFGLIMSLCVNRSKC